MRKVKLQMQLLNGSIEEETARLKRLPGNDLLLYGGASLVSSFIRSGLIDEYHLFMNPSAIGNGKPIFKEVEGRLKLRLIKSRTFPCGIVVLNYQQV